MIVDKLQWYKENKTKKDLFLDAISNFASTLRYVTVIIQPIVLLNSYLIVEGHSESTDLR